MREHNYSSISNTSIHEAYPGHHLQLSVASKHPSLTRLAADAPEFVEGWGMYSEQMMREQGFDDAPNFRLNVHTDAIWRACRIILDVRMHRGEIGVDEAIRWMVEQTSFEEPNARAEVRRYTFPLRWSRGRNRSQPRMIKRRPWLNQGREFRRSSAFRIRTCSRMKNTGEQCQSQTQR